MDVQVVHQVRSPLPWVDSYARRLLVGVGDSLDVIDRVLPGFSERTFADPVRSAMQLYVAWNRLIERSGRIAERHRVEDLTSSHLRHLAYLAQVEVSIDAAESALTRVPCDYNHHSGPADWTSVSWLSLPRSRERDELVDLALAYGYEAS